MITIFKNKQDIPQNMEYIELNDLYFVQNTVSKIDERADKIIECIDGARLVSKYKISSGFNDVVLDIDKLSSGCKTVLNVFYYPEKVFCLKECGIAAWNVKCVCGMSGVVGNFKWLYISCIVTYWCGVCTFHFLGDRITGCSSGCGERASVKGS